MGSTLRHILYFVAVIMLAVAVIGKAFPEEDAVQSPMAAETPKQPPPQPAVTVTRTPQPDGPNTSSQPAEPLETVPGQEPVVVSGKLKRQLVAAVKAYASFPDKDGRESVLARLRRSGPIAPAVITKLRERDWRGPDIRLIDSQVGQVPIEHELLAATNGKFVAHAYPMVRRIHAGGSAQESNPTVAVELARRGRGWEVVGIRYESSADRGSGS